MTSPGELSRRYIERHNDYDLDGLIALVDEAVDFKRSGDAPLYGAAAVRRQYESDWDDHAHVVVTPRRIVESGSTSAIEIHVHSGPPSDVHYDGVVIHDWNVDGYLVRYRLYIDEVASLVTGCDG